LFRTNHHNRLQNISLLLLNKLQAHSSDWFTVVYFIEVAKAWEGLAVGKRRLCSLHMQRFNLNEDKDQYQAEIPNRFAALERRR
jgi:hypothetical protein